MPKWDPGQYLEFEDLRTRPARDLARNVEAVSPRRIADLGCGTGTSTAVCADRWPGASILGIDSSAEMIEKARGSYPEQEWLAADIAEWAREEDGERFDVLFANASLQWVDDHATLFPRLLGRLAPGGVLAVQMPSYRAAPNRAMRELAAEPGWSRWFPTGRAKEWRSHELDFYYEILRPHTARLDLWATEYVQIMPDVGAIVEWYKGTGLRPYLGAIGEEGERERFVREFGERLREVYAESPAGGVLFPFRRVFVVGRL